ncbi:hypothetical protein E2C01_081228 [Portunus trituberculatus]|uniref:Uncharacterized protein n=1 Tax=Portunus trituberculatus TaxID=210409 RepID=A0A5B7IRE3_PORTR|nr:hypothetical protein [Portunus trituberculatus]
MLLNKQCNNKHSWLSITQSFRCHNELAREALSRSFISAESSSTVVVGRADLTMELLSGRGPPRCVTRGKDRDISLKTFLEPEQFSVKHRDKRCCRGARRSPTHAATKRLRIYLGTSHTARCPSPPSPSRHPRTHAPHSALSDYRKAKPSEDRREALVAEAAEAEEPSRVREGRMGTKGCRVMAGKEPLVALEKCSCPAQRRPRTTHTCIKHLNWRGIHYAPYPLPPPPPPPPLLPAFHRLH